MILTADNFEQLVTDSDVPVLVDFWATWCGPCRMMSPVIEELEKEYKGKIKVGKVNVDEQPELSARFRIMSIPTLIYFENGEVKETLIGFRPKEEIKSLLQL